MDPLKNTTKFKFKTGPNKHIKTNVYMLTSVEFDFLYELISALFARWMQIHMLHKHCMYGFHCDHEIICKGIQEGCLFNVSAHHRGSKPFQTENLSVIVK